MRKTKYLLTRLFGEITEEHISIAYRISYTVHSRSATRRDAWVPWMTHCRRSRGEEQRERERNSTRAGALLFPSSLDDAEPTTPTRRSLHSRPIVLNWEGTVLKPYRTACRNAATIGFGTSAARTIFDLQMKFSLTARRFAWILFHFCTVSIGQMTNVR